ncbi:protein IMPACT-like [Arctopsyche grandis]|uniref:protein IMPACT-like n=1 Tax=Arctopsyche grandis TaxID=121162 RepID=UPI00406D7F6D
MDDIAKQADEMETLNAIYGSDWNMGSGGERGHSIEISHGTTIVNLCFTIPKDYPSKAPPIFEMSAPTLNKDEKEKIYKALNEVFAENLGEIMLFQCIEKVREMIGIYEPDVNVPGHSAVLQTPESIVLFEESVECPLIIHGETIEDRKSYFQAHVAVLRCEEQVKVVLNTLKKEPKIAEATHNILAWRFGTHRDYDDDGEKAAGSRLLHLLELLNLNNVIVVVSRWYGGILLGSNRFRHINNAARQALVQAGMINQ